MRQVSIDPKIEGLESFQLYEQRLESLGYEVTRGIYAGNDKPSIWSFTSKNRTESNSPFQLEVSLTYTHVYKNLVWRANLTCLFFFLGQVVELSVKGVDLDDISDEQFKKFKAKLLDSAVMFCATKASWL